MRILFLSHYFYPHVGGVEKHVYKLSQALVDKGHEVAVVTENYSNLKKTETIGHIKILRFPYINRKFIGLLGIWYFLVVNYKLVLNSDVVHIHDVFIWYLPFRFLFFWKKVYVTIHGLEWGNPLRTFSLLQKKIAIRLSNGSIGVGKFLEKYIHMKFDSIIYGASDRVKSQPKKNQIAFLGRLSGDTGVLKFIEFLDKTKHQNVIFIGDGEYRELCEKYGKVYGFVDPTKFIAQSKFVVPGGYLACLEAMNAKCKIMVFFNDRLKEDYWKMSPMYKFIKDQDVAGAFEWVKDYDWNYLSNRYLNLWGV